MKKRIITLLLASSMLAGLVGCGSSKKTAITDEQTELTMFMHFYGYCVYDENWPIFQKAAELTGITLRGTASESISDSSQAWNTMIASTTLPDIIHSTRGNLDDLTQMGGLIPLEDLIDKYAPNVKKFFEDCPDARRVATAEDGHIYYIPGSLSGIDKEATASKGWFIRTDWLEKLGLDVPTDLDSFYNVLKAFKEQDPNGNGQADEIPYFNRQEAVLDLLQLFGATNTWHEDENKNLVYGKTEETYHNAIREIAKWYKEGLIDKEAYTRGQQTREQLLSVNIGGVTHDWFSSTGKYADTYKDSIEGFKWETMMPPKDINGEVKENSSRSVLHGAGWGISKDNKNIEATMKYFDFWMSEVGQDLHNFGVEGIHYNVVNGEKVLTDDVLNAKEGVPTYMRNQGQVEIGTIGDISGEVLGMNEVSKKGFYDYDDSGIVRKQFITPTFTEDEEEQRATWSDITSYVSEMEQKWVLGVSDIDADWDTYLATLKSMGMDNVTDAYNSAYDRWLAS